MQDGSGCQEPGFGLFGFWEFTWLTGHYCSYAPIQIQEMYFEATEKGPTRGQFRGIRQSRTLPTCGYVTDTCL